MSGESAKAEKPRPFPLWVDWAVRVVVIVALVALGALVLADVIGETQGGFFAAVLLLGMILIAVPLARFADVESVKAFGLVEWAFAKQAMEEAPSADLGEDQDDVGEGEEDQITDLQVLLEAKLVYVAKHVIGFKATGRWSPFLTLGSLQYDKFMKKKDAVAARELLRLRPGDLKEVDEKERGAYIARTRKFVRNVRASIFHEVVKTVLEKDLGTTLEERERGGSKRPDFKLEIAGSGRVLVFPAFAGPGAYWNLERIRKRAEELSARADRSMIVVPPNFKKKLKPPVPRVEVVRLDELAAAQSPDDVLPSRFTDLAPGPDAGDG